MQTSIASNDSFRMGQTSHFAATRNALLPSEQLAIS
jgi:hypothetical protein